MKLVISLGGSVITHQNYLNVPQIINILKKLSAQHELFIITGGGEIARTLIEIGKKNNLKREILDMIGIAATRLHAQLFAHLLGYKEYKVPTTVEEALILKQHKKYKIVIMGGTSPFHSTDAVAAELAVKSEADYLVNVSNEDGIYDKDPKKYKDAKPLKKITYKELWKIIKNLPQEPGEYRLFDHLALKLIEKHNIPVKFISLKDLADFMNEEKGTIVIPKK